MDERQFYTESETSKPATLYCPYCRSSETYELRWMVRKKRDRLPGGADERDRALYGKLRDYMVRVDDSVTCKTCGKKFEIPSQHSLMFVDQLAGLPNEEELEREISIASGEPEAAPETKPALPARFTRKSTGWK